MDNVDDKIKELTLLLLYLNSWQEGNGDLAYRRSWKGFDFDTLNQLDAEGLIYDNGKAKSIQFSDEGINKALVIIENYNIDI